MRFFEYEAREIVKRAGIPVTDFGFATTAQEAREIAHRIGGPTVIKSQVLTGGRMKAGGVQFADTPDEAAAKAEQVLALEINGHVPRGVEAAREVGALFVLDCIASGALWVDMAANGVPFLKDMSPKQFKQVLTDRNGQSIDEASGVLAIIRIGKIAENATETTIPSVVKNDRNAFARS